MTQVHFTLETKEIQSLIENAVKDDLAKNILLTVFHQIMEQQRTEYLRLGTTNAPTDGSVSVMGTTTEN